MSAYNKDRVCVQCEYAWQSKTNAPYLVMCNKEGNYVPRQKATRCDSFKKGR